MKFWLVTLVILPIVVKAQLTGIESLIERLGFSVRLLTIVVAGIALLAFFWGLVKFIFAQGSETSKAEAKKIMGWGIIALFVMTSIWGIVYFIGDELLPGVDYDAPRVPVFELI